ncbi:efflux RND transporter periplasmic adaptor subunit [Luteolibacter sp. GHJ8]|uniref:Efflux RND transporter periplasmic adaptor subunit n=1 Tax=Luteolibacter rhizosphaerae TaxID=2989719 RepID=A0ABT3GAY4_9BACT|nr:efflux RND transporter periplasmic adaptor subunit [Luteolibacter rhizosphaerae]MCW1916950.1 efflux RND transporter periplasmic adaptor subunit [Luteolibacter rhizosphaerae]
MKKFSWILMLVLSVTCLLVWKARANSLAASANKGPKGPQTVPVVLTEVAKQDVPVWLEGLGTVQASNTVTVRPRVGGTLESVDFTEGAMVKEGDVLARIDARPYESVLAQARAKKAQDEAQLASAAATLARSQALVKENAVSRQVLDQSEAAAGQLEALVQADQAAIDAAQLDLDFTTVRAPISGRTGVRMVDKGNVVTAGQAEGLVVLTQLQPISVIFTLPQRHLDALRPHMKPGAAALRVQAEDDSGKLLDEGSLELVDNQIDNSTGTLRLKATFPNKDYTLWPGQYVSAKVLVETKSDAVVVPTEVVQPGLNGPFAYLLKPDETVEVRQVKPGMELEGMTVIEEGLSPGDRVVRDGQSKLKPGAKVSEQKAAS